MYLLRRYIILSRNLEDSPGATYRHAIYIDRFWNIDSRSELSQKARRCTRMELSISRKRYIQQT